MKSNRPKPDRESNQYDGYPTWKREKRAEQLKQCFAMLPITTLVAICGRNAVAKVAAALHCQATMQGRITKIVPYTAWRQAIGVSKRSYFRAIATLAKKRFLRRHDKGSGRKAMIELLGPLAQFPKSSKPKRSKARRPQSAPMKHPERDDVWSHIGDPNGTKPA